MDRRWPAFPRSELSGEKRTDSLASIRPVGITVSGPFDSGIDRLWFASFRIVRSLIAKGLNFAENRLRAAPWAMQRSRINQETLPATRAFAGSNNFAAELPCLPQAHTPAIILSDQAPTSSHRCGHPERSLARFLLQAESNYLRLFLS